MPKRKNEAVRQARLKALHEKLIERDMRKALRAMIVEVARNRKRIDAITKKHEALIGKVIVRRMRPLMTASGNAVLTTIAGKKAALPFDYEAKKVASSFGSAITQYLVEFGIKHGQTISRSLRRILIRMIAQAIEEGLGEREVARRIEREAEQISQARARRIARTETHTAAERAAYEAAQASGLDMVKEWASTEDARVRPSHDDADGAIAEMDEFFSVGDSDMLYPGDMNGELKEIVNCRCTALYHPRVNGRIFR